MTPAPPTFRDRARASLLGLALGDLYGAPLEFLRGPAVHSRPVDPTAADATWTDDTHMTLYVGQATLEILRDGYDDDRFGHAIGRHFRAWLVDPLTPSTAPGTTCLAGARAYDRDGDWRTSGVRHSDGCGAVMRVGPLGIAWSGDPLTRAARVQALVTHAHPNAPDAAVALAWLHREVLEDGVLTAATVERIVARGRAAGLAVEALAALEAAISAATAHRPGAALDERAIPAGDGGWRSPSCVGLAVYANLVGGTFADIIDRAARIDGDSDSVAAVAGMLAGAARPDELPAPWLANLPRRDELIALADALCGPTRPQVRTSVDDPLRIFEVCPEVAITMAPGKRGPSIHGHAWDRDLGVDLGAVVQSGRRLLICLLEDHELSSRHIEDLPARAAEKGLRFVQIPLRDLGPPSDTQMHQMLALVRETPAVIHCMGGVGRSGTAAACVLVAKGLSPDAAIAAVRRVQPRAVETASQTRFVHHFTTA